MHLIATIIVGIIIGAIAGAFTSRDFPVGGWIGNLIAGLSRFMDRSITIWRMGTKICRYRYFAIHYWSNFVSRSDFTNYE